MRQRMSLVWVVVAPALATLIGASGMGVAPPIAQAQDEPFVLTFKDNKLEPAELQVPAGKDFKLLVKNADQSAEEFESEDLKLEKVIAGGSETAFTIKALEAGSYEVYGEFHEDTA